MRLGRGFTLVELIVVMGITMILLTVIMVPVTQSFQLVTATQSEANLQRTTRNLLERISREVSNSAGIRYSKGSIAVTIPNNRQRLHEIATVILNNAMLDFYLPAQSRSEPHDIPIQPGYYNPNIQRYDPTLRSPKGDIVLSATPGMSMVRYFIGLKEPLDKDNPGKYNNPYENLLSRVGSGRENLYVLYRAEVQPYLYRGGKIHVNTDLFESKNGQPYLDDPYFFTLRTYEPNRKQKIRRITRWKKISSIMSGSNRADMIMPIVTTIDGKRALASESNGFPMIRSLVQFTPNSVRGEILRPMPGQRWGDEALESDHFVSDTYIADQGNWNNGQIIMRQDSDELLELKGTIPKNSFDPRHVNIFYNQKQLFSGSIYHDPQTTYRFSQALSPSLENKELREIFAPFVIDPYFGRLKTSFAISEVGNPYKTLSRRIDNRPFIQTGQINSLNASDLLFHTLLEDYLNPLQAINLRYEALYNIESIYQKEVKARESRIFRVERSQYAKRFIDLKQIPCADGTFSPLHPDYGFARAMVTPGSEIIIGPDYFNPGHLIRYIRASHYPIGPNQYLINYLDQQEPIDLEGLVFQPYFQNAFVKQKLKDLIFRPRYQAGYIEFCSDPEIHLPLGEISIFYRFQFNRKNDLFYADYDSNNIMGIQLSISYYPSANLSEPQQMSLSNSVKIKNLFR